MAAVTSDIVAAAKMARRITTNEYDSQIADLLNAALLDLGVAGVVVPASLDPLVKQAAITYFLLHFGEPGDRDFLKKSYDEQKAQLSMCSGYTDWGVING